MENRTPALWSIVIPAYNEAKRLPVYLREVLDYFDSRGDPFEVLVVDDGSVDETAACVRGMVAAHPAVRLCVLPAHRGKGYAVRVGMLQARGRFRVMTDADGATPIAELSRLEHALLPHCDLVVGARGLADDSALRHTLGHRRLSGIVFNAIARGLGVRDVVDTQCGFTLFRGTVADDLFAGVQTDGFGFDVEVLLLAERRGYRTAEVPINWPERPGHRGRVSTDAPRMLAQILAARWRVGHPHLEAAIRQREAMRVIPWLPHGKKMESDRMRRVTSASAPDPR